MAEHWIYVGVQYFGFANTILFKFDIFYGTINKFKFSYIGTYSLHSKYTN